MAKLFASEAATFCSHTVRPAKQTLSSSAALIVPPSARQEVLPRLAGWPSGTEGWHVLKRGHVLKRLVLETRGPPRGVAIGTGKGFARRSSHGGLIPWD